MRSSRCCAHPHALVRQGVEGVFFDMDTCTCDYFDADTQEKKSKAKVRSSWFWAALAAL